MGAGLLDRRGSLQEESMAVDSLNQDETSRVVDLEFRLKNLILHRKLKELTNANGQPLLPLITIEADEYVNNVTAPKYNNPSEATAQSKMDGYWARTRISFTDYQRNGRLSDFLPGRWHIYNQLAAVILNHLNNEEFRKGMVGRTYEPGAGSATLTHIVGQVLRPNEAVIVDMSQGGLDFGKYFGKAQFGNDRKITPVKADMFTYTDKEEFDIAMNSGVIEHLNYADQVRLVTMMRDSVRPGGFVFVAMPNANSQLYQAVDRAVDDAEWYKKSPELFKYPIAISGESDLKRVFEKTRLNILSAGGVSLAPAIVDRELCNGMLEIYGDIVPQVGSGMPNKEKMRTWLALEIAIAKDIGEQKLMENAWYQFALGQKTSN